MKIRFRIRDLHASAFFRARLEKQLERLPSLIKVTTADVVLERQRENAPAFRTSVYLAVPGPDIHAVARDHTLEAVWLKVTRDLQKQIERGKTRHKGRRQHRLTASRSPRGL